MDPYYQKLNELFGKKSLDQDLAMDAYQVEQSERDEIEGDSKHKKR